MEQNEILAPLSNIKTPNPLELNQRAQAALNMVNDMQIDSQESYELAADELKAIKTKAKSLEEQRKTIVDPLNKATKAINDLFRNPAQFLVEAEKIIKTKMIKYTEIQERIAEEARRKAEEQQRIERARLAAEAAEREEKARQEAERLAIEAKQAEAEGDVGKAAEAAAKAEMVVASAVQETIALESTAAAMTVPVVAAPIGASGISKVKVTHKARVVDKAKFLAFVATRPEMLEMIDVNESKLNAMARALKASMVYPGIEVYEDKTIAARA